MQHHNSTQNDILTRSVAPLPDACARQHDLPTARTPQLKPRNSRRAACPSPPVAPLRCSPPSPSSPEPDMRSEPVGSSKLASAVVLVAELCGQMYAN